MSHELSNRALIQSFHDLDSYCIDLERISPIRQVALLDT